MTTIKKAVVVCDQCGEEVDDLISVSTRMVQNEGCSEIITSNKTYEVDDADFCDLDCLFTHIRMGLRE